MEKITATSVRAMEGFIFWSRWLQAPLYLGLIAAQGVYVYQFMHELSVLVTKAGSLTEAEVMLIVLGLIDVVMIANLLIMVIIGGYETFVSKLDLHPPADQISIHLLRTSPTRFSTSPTTIRWQSTT
jgi:uncharacterized protein (TIGR00645 family)